MPRAHEEARGGDLSGQASLKSGPWSQWQVALLEIVMVVMGVTEGDGTELQWERKALSLVPKHILTDPSGTWQSTPVL